MVSSHLLLGLVATLSITQAYPIQSNEDIARLSWASLVARSPAPRFKDPVTFDTNSFLDRLKETIPTASDINKWINDSILKSLDYSGDDKNDNDERSDDDDKAALATSKNNRPLATPTLPISTPSNVINTPTLAATSSNSPKDSNDSTNPFDIQSLLSSLNSWVGNLNSADEIIPS